MGKNRWGVPIRNSSKKLGQKVFLIGPPVLFFTMYIHCILYRSYTIAAISTTIFLENFGKKCIFFIFFSKIFENFPNIHLRYILATLKITPIYSDISDFWEKIGRVPISTTSTNFCQKGMLIGLLVF